MSVNSNIIVLSTVVSIVLVLMIVTAVFVYQRGEKQPLKIRSSKLLFVAVCANIALVIQIYVIQMHQEICVNLDGI